MEPWKKHSGSTGGYFQCNRYEATNKITQKTKHNISAAEEAHLKAVESNKFAHYYTRFKNHENSYKLEEPLLTKAKMKFETLICQKQDAENQVDYADEGLEKNQHLFIEEAIRELLKARKILRCSYVYGYYLGNSFVFFNH